MRYLVEVWQPKCGTSALGTFLSLSQAISELREWFRLHRIDHTVRNVSAVGTVWPNGQVVYRVTSFDAALTIYDTEPELSQTQGAD